MKAVNRYLPMQQADFITKNGDDLIPSIAINALNSYTTFLMKKNES